jgi:hypothetical protein
LASDGTALGKEKLAAAHYFNDVEFRHPRLGDDKEINGNRHGFPDGYLYSYLDRAVVSIGSVMRKCAPLLALGTTTI